MSMFSGIERRVYFRAYASGIVCTVSIRQTQYQVDMIDISPAGTRLRFPAKDVPAIKEFDTITLSCGTPSLSGLINGIAAEVRWVSRSEIGVRFQEELPIASSDIQRLIA